MREQRNDPKRLNDILQAIDTIFEYVGDRDMKDFLADKRSYHAVIYNIMIIGEAANMLTFEFREAHSDMKWRQTTSLSIGLCKPSRINRLVALTFPRNATTN